MVSLKLKWLIVIMQNDRFKPISNVATESLSSMNNNQIQDKLMTSYRQKQRERERKIQREKTILIYYNDSGFRTRRYAMGRDF